jgi:hypothetical protein
LKRKEEKKTKRKRKAAVSPTVAPTPVVSTVADAAMNVGEKDDASTASVQSTRTYASVIGKQVLPTEVTRETETPSPVTASEESSTHKSEIAALKSLVAKLQAQLATQARDPPEVRSTAETADSDPSPLTASTPDAALAGDIAPFPPRILYGTQAMQHAPPSYDPPPSKRSRQSVPIETQSAPVAGPPDEDDADLLVNTAASQVSTLSLDNIPRSPTRESGMPI